MDTPMEEDERLTTAVETLYGLFEPDQTHFILLTFHKDGMHVASSLNNEDVTGVMVQDVLPFFEAGPSYSYEHNVGEGKKKLH